MIQNQIISPYWPERGPYKSQIGPKWSENVVFKSRKWHYILYVQLLLINLISNIN